MQQEDGFYPYGGEDDEEMYYGNYTVNGGNKPFQTQEKERETEKGTEKGKEDECMKEFERICEDLFYNGNIENKEMRIHLGQIFPFLSLPPEDKLVNIGAGARPAASGLGTTTVKSGNRVPGIVPTKSGKVRMLNTSKNMSKTHHNGGLGTNLSEFIEEVLYSVPHLERKKHEGNRKQPRLSPSEPSVANPNFNYSFSFPPFPDSTALRQKSGESQGASGLEGSEDADGENAEGTASGEDAPSGAQFPTTMTFQEAYQEYIEEKIDVKESVLGKLLDMMQSMRRHAPWHKFTFEIKTAGVEGAGVEGVAGADSEAGDSDVAEDSEAGVEGARLPEQLLYDPVLDLSISDGVYLEYLEAYRASRIGVLLKAYEFQEVVNLILESESDVWMACGGTNSTLPDATWITRGSKNHTASKEKTQRDSIKQFFNDPKANLAELVTGDTNAISDDIKKVISDDIKKCQKAFFSNTYSLETQLYNIGVGEASIKKFGKKFRVWKKKENKKVVFEITDILMKGGYDRSNLEEDADALVLTALFSGIIDDPSNAGAEMLLGDFQNVGGIIQRGLQLTGYGLKSYTEYNIHYIANCFRRGREKILKELAQEMVSGNGGPEATLITNAEYRNRFITLCRANYEIRQLDENRVVGDRRQRMLEQQRNKRECLHFFQKINGNAVRVSQTFMIYH